MAAEISLSNRAQFFITALAKANRKLQSHQLAVGVISKLTKIKGEAVNLDDFDQRTDFDLALRSNNIWMRIDVVYLGPKKPTSVKEFSQDIYRKAIDHIQAMRDKTVFITSVGTKYNTAHLKNHTFEIDSQGYLRVNGLRIISKEQQMYRPVKATHFRSHTRITPEELTGDVLNLTEQLNRGIRENGKFCVTKKAQFIALERILPRKQAEAQEYEEDQYIPLVFRWREVERLVAGTSNFFSE